VFTQTETRKLRMEISYLTLFGGPVYV